MCGIVGYLGNSEAVPILLNGLKRLEYRGYDSAGIAVLNSSGIDIVKEVGKIRNLETALAAGAPKGTIGIGHTRRATHGQPNKVNAHPHSDQSGNIVLIHNGIIENYTVLKKALQQKGHVFKTDSSALLIRSSIRKPSP